MGVIQGHLGRQMGHLRWSQQGDASNHTKAEVVNLSGAMLVFRHNVKMKKKTFIEKRRDKL